MEQQQQFNSWNSITITIIIQYNEIISWFNFDYTTKPIAKEEIIGYELNIHHSNIYVWRNLDRYKTVKSISFLFLHCSISNIATCIHYIHKCISQMCVCVYNES